VASFVSDVLDLDQKYVDWAIAKFRHERFKQPMNKLHQDMHDTWQEILTTSEACVKATEARLHAQGKKMHGRTCGTELERRELKRMQRDMR
jgi:hypothetical protein